jgi:tRNA threonylcarbamoyladenosine biosynthesis protein TsaE
MTLSVRRVGPESAAAVLTVIQDAFGGRPPLDPPADALSDTEASIATRLALGGGLVARLDGDVVGALLFEEVGDIVYLRRFGVLTAARGHGVAHALVAAGVEAASTLGGHARVSVVAREELPRTIEFWRHHGFVQNDRRSPYVELSHNLPTRHEIHHPDAMRDLGRRVAGRLRTGDLLLLTGDLGAGKTTFTQGLGAGLGVAGRVTSPTFIIAREHPAGPGGTALVHVDAYRLGSTAELDDLDLDTALDEAVTVVEWGEGKAEKLADSRLEVRITRTFASPDVVGADSEIAQVGEVVDVTDVEPRLVEILGRGPRWATSWPWDDGG